MPDNRPVLRAVAIAVVCAFFVSSAKAVRELVTIDELQPAQRVEGVVLDPSGASLRQTPKEYYPPLGTSRNRSIAIRALLSLRAPLR